MSLSIAQSDEAADTTRRQRIARRLRDERIRQAKTQEHVAGEAGVSAKTVRRAEAGETMSAETLRALCAVLGLDAAELGGLESQANSASHALFLRKTVYGNPRLKLRRKGIDEADFSLAVMFASALFTGACAFLSLEKPKKLTPFSESLFDYLQFFFTDSSHVLSEWKYWECICVIIILTVHYFVVLAKADAPRYPDGVVVSDSERRQARIPMFTPLATVVGAAGGYLINEPIWPVLLATSLYMEFSRVTLSRLGDALAPRSMKVLTSVQAQVDSFPDTVRPIMDRLRLLLDAQPTTDRFDRALDLLREAQAAADAAGRSPDVAPLEMLLEDLARGISGRKGLLDYISLAERMCGPHPLNGRLREDADMLFKDLRRRVNAFA